MATSLRNRRAKLKDPLSHNVANPLSQPALRAIRMCRLAGRLALVSRQPGRFFRSPEVSASSLEQVEKIISLGLTRPYRTQ